MALTAAERENCLVYDEETDKYQIFCSSSKEITRMKKAGFEPHKIDEDGNWYVTVERKQISFRNKNEKGKREMSEEHKVKLLAGLERAREARKGENNGNI